MKAHFLIQSVESIDRHTEPRYESLKMGDIVPARGEEVTIMIKLVSSGNTTKITNTELSGRIMDKLEKI
ncbi:MAG TPA: hypothetical protein ENH82_18750 [bacterium]|nr:hypothetical protein [bacterium]